ncbi:MAG: HPr-rel-A system PqqD family peptide chaperone [Lentisphaeria bacterium]|nr:HPr-rel-A system PqqD family peptide chaperone [Lentisphaeria bacterium]
MIKVNPTTVFREEFDNSAILFNPDSGDIFSLNPTGRVIWQALAEGGDEAAALKKLAENCQEPLPESAADDLREFIVQLKDKGFVADV